jgi:hypothetical protein
LDFKNPDFCVYWGAAMVPRFATFARCFLCAAALALRAGAEGNDASPFLPVSGPGAAAGQAPDGTSYELRGIMSAGNGLRFCIFDPVKKTSAWVALNESGNAFVVTAADPAHDAVTLEAGGQRLTITLREAKVVSLTNNMQAAPPPGMPIGRVVLRPTPEDEQRRLQAIAEEVRRRREMRERAQPGQPGQR